MKVNNPNITEEIALSTLTVGLSSEDQNFSPGQWVTLLRKTLRMTQSELAERVNITRANLVAIESGKADPRVGTLRRIYQGLSCHLEIAPRPQKPIEKILRGRARVIAQRRLEKETKSMALEEGTPNKKTFKKILKKRTDEILQNPRERLWRGDQE